MLEVLAFPFPFSTYQNLTYPESWWSANFACDFMRSLNLNCSVCVSTAFCLPVCYCMGLISSVLWLFTKPSSKARIVSYSSCNPRNIKPREVIPYRRQLVSVCWATKKLNEGTNGKPCGGIQRTLLPSQIGRQQITWEFQSQEPQGKAATSQPEILDLSRIYSHYMFLINTRILLLALVSKQ